MLHYHWEVMRRAISQTLIKGLVESMRRNHVAINLDLLDYLFRNLFEKSRQFYLFDSVYDERSHRSEMKSEIAEQIVIILQGSIKNNSCFLKETLDLYAQGFKGAEIILSSWDDEIKFLPRGLSKKIIKVSSSKPLNPGISNINLQIVSTKNALECARKLNRKYVVKTRTDQRIAKQIGIQKIIEGLELNSRRDKKLIAIPSSNTFLYRIYGATDQLQISEIDNLIKYWSCDLDTRETNQSAWPFSKNLSMRQHSELKLSEVYLAFNYVKSQNDKAKFTFEDWTKALTRHFLIFEDREIGLVWGKYSFNQSRFGQNTLANPLYELTSLDHALLQADSGFFSKYEYMLDVENKEEI